MLSRTDFGSFESDGEYDGTASSACSREAPSWACFSVQVGEEGEKAIDFSIIREEYQGKK